MTYNVFGGTLNLTQSLQFSGLRFVTLDPFFTVHGFTCVCVFYVYFCHTAYVLCYCNTVGWN